MSTKFKDYQTKPNQIKEEQRTQVSKSLRLAGGVEPVDVENLELVGSKPWRSRADGRRGGARAILVATERRSAAPAAIAMPTTATTDAVDLVRLPPCAWRL